MVLIQAGATQHSDERTGALRPQPGLIRLVAKTLGTARVPGEDTV